MESKIKQEFACVDPGCKYVSNNPNEECCGHKLVKSGDKKSEKSGCACC